MSYETTLNQWKQELSICLPTISAPLSNVLALYTFGMATLCKGGQTKIAQFLAQLLGGATSTLEQRLSELLYDAEDKRGADRQELELAPCFVDMMRWVSTHFAPTQREWVLGIDATHLKDRWICLCVSVMVGSCAIPVAWHIQKADTKGEWNPIWERLLRAIQPAFAHGDVVYVLADSGIYSRRLFLMVRDELQWHPHFRISGEGLCRDANGEWHPLSQEVAKGMTPIIKPLICFKEKSLDCTAICEWEATMKDPCIVLTDLPPQQAIRQTYSLRYWIECGFKDLKRGGLEWDKSKMKTAERMERLWLVMSIALLWLVRLGQATQAVWPAPQYQLRRQAKHSARLSLLAQGHITLLIHLIKGCSLPAPSAFSYPSDALPTLLHLTERQT